MTSQRQLLKRFRRITMLTAVLGLAYIVMRFDIVALPDDRGCPLNRFAPGDRLIVDGRPSHIGAGDAVLVRTAAGGLHLTRVSAVRSTDGALWCKTDNPDVAGLTSDDVGWIQSEAVDGRVLLRWDY